MAESPIGIWLVGAYGGVGSTTALGVAGLSQKLIPPTGLVTELPAFGRIEFPPFNSLVVGGHDIRQGSFSQSLAELHSRSAVFPQQLLAATQGVLDSWSANVRPGIVLQSNSAIQALVNRPDVPQARTAQEAIQLIQDDLKAFQKKHRLASLVVVNVASTEPPFECGPEQAELKTLESELTRTNSAVLPTSSLYAYAAIDAGYPYLNATPSTGASLPALEQLAKVRGVPHAGQDLKTGETLLKSVLAPMFARRNLRVMSWVSHNILGNRDGQILADPENKASKVKSKESLLGELLGYKPQSHVSIEYIESLDDWKTAWDHVHFEGFLGTKMTLQFTWQGCDSVLAAPLVVDLVRILDRARCRGEIGSLPALACFFKSPLGVAEHDFARQFELLENYLLG